MWSRNIAALTVQNTYETLNFMTLKKIGGSLRHCCFNFVIFRLCIFDCKQIYKSVISHNNLFTVGSLSIPPQRFMWWFDLYACANIGLMKSFNLLVYSVLKTKNYTTNNKYIWANQWPIQSIAWTCLWLILITLIVSNRLRFYAELKTIFNGYIYRVKAPQNFYLIFFSRTMTMTFSLQLICESIWNVDNWTNDLRRCSGSYNVYFHI